MIKGFTSIKFLLGCCLSYLILYSIFLFYSSWNEYSSVNRVISVLIFLVTSVIMWGTQSPKMMYRFLLGAERYNQIIYLDESKIKINKLIKSQLPYHNQQQKNNTKFSKIKNNQHKIRKFHSLYNQKDQRQHLHLFNRASLPLNNQNQEFLKNLWDLRSQEQIKKTNQYMEFIKRLPIQGFKFKMQNQMTVKKCYRIIGQIFQKQRIRHIQNLNQLKYYLQSLYDISIIDYNKDFSFINQGIHIEDRYRNRRRLNTKFQVTIDQILQNYNERQLRKNGYRLNNQFSGDTQQRAKKTSKIQKTIKERRMLDRRINFGSEFPNNRKRLQVIRKIAQIAQKAKKNQSIINEHQLISQSYEQTQLVIWILSRYINQIVRDKLNSATIYLDSRTIVGEYPIFYWLQQSNPYIVHYNLSYRQNPEKESILHLCNSKDNIVSVFYNYLCNLSRFLSWQLPRVPELNSYVQEVISYT